MLVVATKILGLLAAPKKWKSAGVDTMSAELEENMIDVLTKICIKIGKQENGQHNGLSH